MLRKLVVLGVLSMLPALAWAQPQDRDWELKLVGSGSSDHDFNSSSISTSAEVGYYLTKSLEVGVRQSIGYADTDVSGSVFNGSTTGLIDWNFDLDKFVPFIGFSAGYTYGDTTEDSWLLALEGGLKYYIHKNAFVFGQIAYQWLLDGSFTDDGIWVYSLGIGVNF